MNARLFARVVGLFVGLAAAVFLGFLSFGKPVLAQPAAGGEDTESGEPGEAADETQPTEEEPRLRPPSLEALDLDSTDVEASDEDGEDASDGDDDDEMATPDEATERLSEGGPPSSDPTRAEWTAPLPVFTLHGYFRVRGEMQDTFYLGRIDAPFSRFRPFENGVVPEGGGCGDALDGTACDTEALSFANTRLRLEPTLALSDDVRVHLQLDVFDNMVLGSTPDGFVVNTDAASYDRTPRVPLDSFTTTAQPPVAYRNSLSDSVVARRAWAEVTNRGLGQLRFGRMGSHWGLGLLANGGEGADADYQSDVDRVMFITRLRSFYLVGAYDFAAEGFIQQNLNDMSALAYDAGQEDDVDQWVLAVAHRADEEDQQERLQRGDWVLNAGAYFVYRSQFLSSQGAYGAFEGPPPPSEVSSHLRRRDAEAFIPDVWAQFLWRKLRIEIEAVLIAGSIHDATVRPDMGSTDGLTDLNVFQFGTALEAEYRLLDDKLGLYFHAGFATGDSDTEGLTLDEGLAPQHSDSTISTFRFHPAYRIDLILWRSIMRQVAGAYYFRPGISYDFIRNTFGQLFGARLDAIWSRATSPVQSYGNDPDLGIELDLSVYYRSEDGPELLDGFYAQAQYGILFPMQGLGNLGAALPGASPDLQNAQTVRLQLGVMY